LGALVRENQFKFRDSLTEWSILDLADSQVGDIIEQSKKVQGLMGNANRCLYITWKVVVANVPRAHQKPTKIRSFPG
jgi:hypothetical protein